MFLIHGGAWISGDKTMFEPGSNYATEDVATWFSNHGITAVSIDYPLHNWRTGAGTMGMIYSAVRSAVNWVKARAHTFDIDASDTAAWGMSAGGHLASLLGTHGFVNAVVADSAPEDLSSISTMRTIIEQMMPTQHDQRYWSPEYSISAATCNDWYLAAGTQDATVSAIQQTDAFNAALQANGKQVTLQTYSGGHAFADTAVATRSAVIASEEAWVATALQGG